MRSGVRPRRARPARTRRGEGPPGPGVGWALPALVVWALAAAPAAAGALQEPAPDLGRPGPEHRRLDALAGLWDVTVVVPTVAGRVLEGRAACEAGWTLDGRFLRQEYASVFDGQPLTVVRYVGFDRHAGTFVEVQFESSRTDVLHARGTLSGDGRTLTSSGTHVEPATGREALVRTVTTFVDPETFTLELTYADSVGQVARSVLLTHRRRGPGSAAEPAVGIGAPAPHD